MTEDELKKKQDEEVEKTKAIMEKQKAERGE
jgi:hypothetical protein